MQNPFNPTFGDVPKIQIPFTMTISSFRGLVSFADIEKLKQLDRNGWAVIYIGSRIKRKFEARKRNICYN